MNVIVNSYHVSAIFVRMVIKRLNKIIIQKNIDTAKKYGISARSDIYSELYVAFFRF